MGDGFDIKWHGGEYKKALEDRFRRNLERAAITVKNKAKVLVSEPYPPSSAEDNPPHRRTGRLRASIAHEIAADGKSARVGTNVKYGKFLELGTKKMAKRPYLEPALEQSKEQVEKLLKEI